MAQRPKLEGAARVLVVADPPLADVVTLALNHVRYQVQATSSVSEARTRLRETRPHLIIVDPVIGEGEASTLIGRRIAARRVPTIVLTERGDLKAKLDAFERGADDFLTVPISPEELVARTLALMRRTYGDSIPFVPVIKVDELEIDLLNRRVRAGSAVLKLTAIEQALLYLLASNPGRILAREEILDSVWGADYVAESNLVDRHIRNLRVKLKNSWRRPRFIATVPGKGYRFLASP